MAAVMRSDRRFSDYKAAVPAIITGDIACLQEMPRQKACFIVTGRRGKQARGP